ncbi:MAG: hypothetical protein ACRDWN_02910, partial [Acidimicrobiales bacterium]
RSVVILWAWTALLSGFILFPLFVHQVNAFIQFGAAALGIGLYTFFHPEIRHRGEEEAALAGNGAGAGRAGRAGWAPRVLPGRAAAGLRTRNGRARPDGVVGGAVDRAADGAADGVADGEAGRPEAPQPGGHRFADRRDGMP